MQGRPKYDQGDLPQASQSRSGDCRRADTNESNHRPQRHGHLIYLGLWVRGPLKPDSPRCQCRNDCRKIG